MKVILNADVKGTGKKGQLVDVADGYANNFLLRRKLAVPANAQALNEMRNRDASQAFKIAQEKKAAEEAAAAVNGKTVKISAKAGAGGKLFGSVTVKEISEAISAQCGTDVDKRKISIDNEIKAFGTYTAELKLYAGVLAKVYVVVGEE